MVDYFYNIATNVYNIVMHIELQKIKIIGAALAAAIALWRYVRSERQAQGRNASSLIETFSKGPQNQAAMRMIDWRNADFSVMIAGQWRIVKFDSQIVADALRPHTESNAFTNGEQIIRDVMDNYLSDLEISEFLIKRFFISNYGFDSYFYYWRNKLGRNTRYVPDNDGAVHIRAI